MSEAITEDRRLNSWKEIAAYFGHDQRTVKRWEHSRGLPVRRLPGTRSHVFALVSEIEAWQRGEPLEPEDVRPGSAEESRSEVFDPAALFLSKEELPVPPKEELPSESVSQVETAPLQPAARMFHVSHSRPVMAASVMAVLLALVGVALAASRYHHAVLASQQQIHIPEPRAKELYLEGRFRWSKRTPDDLRAALEDFRQAVQIDPLYAAAYAGMADCYALTPQFAEQYETSSLPQMLLLARKAIALDPNLPEGHRALAFADFYWRWDREGSRAEFEKAIALAPQDAVTHLWFANTLATEGLSDQALAEVERARELNPTEPAIVADRGWVLLSAGRMEQARSVLEQMERTNPENRMAPLWLSWIDYDEHRSEEFLAELRTFARLSGGGAAAERLAVAEQGFRAGGEPAMRKALVRLALARADAGQISPYAAALELERAGRRAESLAYLQKALAARDVEVQAVTNPREFFSLRGMSDFQDILRRVQQPL